MSAIHGPDGDLIELCIEALGTQATARMANGTPGGIPDELMNEINEWIYAAIGSLTALKATTEFGRRLKALVAFEMLESVEDALEGKEAVALSALRDLVGSATA
jgi:hypothetical protein